VGDENIDVNLPVDGDWHRVRVDEFDEYWSLSGKARVHLKAVYRFVNSSNTALMVGGGTNDQPKIFWQIVDVMDRMRYAYSEKDKAKNGDK
jgi:hypothetical protein